MTEAQRLAKNKARRIMIDIGDVIKTFDGKDMLYVMTSAAYKQSMSHLLKAFSIISGEILKEK